jgi:hypothetical protein
LILVSTKWRGTTVAAAVVVAGVVDAVVEEEEEEEVVEEEVLFRYQMAIFGTKLTFLQASLDPITRRFAITDGRQCHCPCDRY